MGPKAWNTPSARVGMPATEVIQSTTVTNTKFLGMSDEIGSVEVNPLQDVAALQKMILRMKDGIINVE